MTHFSECPDSERSATPKLTRRDWIRTTGCAAVAASANPLVRPLVSVAEEAPEQTSENVVQQLFTSLTPAQQTKICFPWDHQDDRGLLRTHVSNNWNITDVKTLNVSGGFFTGDQQEMIESLFFGLYNPDWRDRIRRQLQDDAGGYGRAQTIAIFGEPGTEHCEFVMTGRHLTIRCDGNTTEHVAFGGPIFYGHASKGSRDAFYEEADHPGNVFWPQAQKANRLYEMLDGRQRKQALIAAAPDESAVGFQGREGRFPGVPISELSADQRSHAQEVLRTLLDPYRLADREEVLDCLEAQGGLDACSLAFYQSDDIGDDGVWDVWRLEGPSFVWHFRGSPHVHVWVNVADDSSVKLNAAG